MTDQSRARPLVTQVIQRFRREFPTADPKVFFAPGRVNLVGAHLDYNGGPVLPIAVDRGVYAATRLRTDGLIRLRSLDRSPGLDIAADQIKDSGVGAHDWANYALGVWWHFKQKTGHGSGVELVYASDLPIASGLSSSAALEVSTAFALDALHGSSLTAVELAMLGFKAETEYVGLRCGIMDQFASALGRQGHALLLNCEDATYDHVPFDASAAELLVMDSGVPRRLGDTSFNDRVAECAEAYRVLRSVAERPCLAAYDKEDLAAAGEVLHGTCRMRAEHVVSEVARVESAVDGLRRGNLIALGRALNESHGSTRDLFEVSSPELDALTGAARELDEVYGARLTGAGFGGCAIALIRPGSRAAVEEHVGRKFAEEFRRRPHFDLLREGHGPKEFATASELV